MDKGVYEQRCFRKRGRIYRAAGEMGSPGAQSGKAAPVFREIILGAAAGPFPPGHLGACLFAAFEPQREYELMAIAENRERDSKTPRPAKHRL
jgi:hypothetical protein